MKLAEIAAKAQFVVDANGERTAALIDYETWEEILESLEDLEDLVEVNRIRESGEVPIPMEQMEAELRAENESQPTDGETTRPYGLCAGEFVVPDDFDDPLPDNVIDEFGGNRTMRAGGETNDRAG